MAPTITQLQRVEAEYTKLAQEPVEVQFIAGTLYAYGSELATLRLFRAMPTKRQGYSVNLGRHFFAADL